MIENLKQNTLKNGYGVDNTATDATCTGNATFDFITKL